MTSMNLGLDAESLYLQLLAQIKEGTAHVQNVAIVGIYSGGVWIDRGDARDVSVIDVRRGDTR